jgi:hypothetical protein
MTTTIVIALVVSALVGACVSTAIIIAKFAPSPEGVLTHELGLGNVGKAEGPVRVTIVNHSWLGLGHGAYDVLVCPPGFPKETISLNNALTGEIDRKCDVHTFEKYYFKLKQKTGYVFHATEYEFMTDELRAGDHYTYTLYGWH